VLDTHAWLWWAASPGRLSRSAALAIERADRIGISAMAVLELAELVERRRVELDLPVRAWVRSALAQPRVEPMPLTPEVALDAGQLRFAGDPFDRVIYATARAEGAKLVTRDERLRAFDPALTIW
jgi:PIN domain nuclease of toxin-antitoxin system